MNMQVLKNKKYKLSQKPKYLLSQIEEDIKVKLKNKPNIKKKLIIVSYFDEKENEKKKSHINIFNKINNKRNSNLNQFQSLSYKNIINSKLKNNSSISKENKLLINSISLEKIKILNNSNVANRNAFTERLVHDYEIKKNIFLPNIKQRLKSSIPRYERNNNNIFLKGEHFIPDLSFNKYKKVINN